MRRQHTVGAGLAGTRVVVAALQSVVTGPSSPPGWISFGVLASAAAVVAAWGNLTQAPPS